MLSSANAKVTRADTATLAVLPASQRAGFMRSLKAFAEALDKLDSAAAGPKKRKTKKRKAAKKKAKRKAPAKRRATKRKARRKTKRR